MIDPDRTYDMSDAYGPSREDYEKDITRLELYVKQLEKCIAEIIVVCDKNIAAEDVLPYPLSATHAGYNRACRDIRRGIETRELLALGNSDEDSA